MTIQETITSFHRQLGYLSREKKISHVTNRVLAVLASFLGPDGLFPSHESIAERTGCHRRTVIRALERAYELGIVERTHQRTRLDGKWVRTSNRYRLIVTKTGQAKAAAKNVFRRVKSAMRARSLSLSDRIAPEGNALSLFKMKPTIQEPQMTHEELLEYCRNSPPYKGQVLKPL